MKAALARIWLIAFPCAACVSAASCAVAPLPNTSPPLVESRAKDIVVLIDVASVRDFERDGCFGYVLEGDDGSVEVLCASPPPFRVRANVVTQLYGPPIRRSITFKTESHWGSHFLTDGNLKLVHLVTDGDVVLMPNEEASDVGSDSRGDLFVPAYPGGISWLPCGTDPLKEQVTFRVPANRFAEPSQEPVLATPPGRLAEDRAFFVADGGRRYPRFGIPIESISEFLRAKQPGRDDFAC